MRMMYKMFAKKLFGLKYEHLKKVLMIDLMVFWGLRIAGCRLEVSPSVMYLMVSTFSAGVMWRALSSEDNAANMKNMFMLPFENRQLVYAYVSAMGTYTLFSKTAFLLAVVLGITAWRGTPVLFRLVCIIACAVNAVLVTACVYAWGKRHDLQTSAVHCGATKRVHIWEKHYALQTSTAHCGAIKRGHVQEMRWVAGVLWGVIVAAAMLLLWQRAVFVMVIAASALSAFLVLSGTSAYAFYRQDSEGGYHIKSSGHPWVWRYLFRYLRFHTNYLFNTVVLWGVACVLPAFFGQLQTQLVLPIGFAVLSVNTPIGILLSCDPSLEQAMRALPGQWRAFCVPYMLFIFCCNLTADLIFLGSLWLQSGGVTAASVLAAFVFALLGALGSVLMEWFFPIRGWKLENDLWHHPRKYVVPAVLLLAGAALTLIN